MNPLKKKERYRLSQKGFYLSLNENYTDYLKIFYKVSPLSRIRTIVSNSVKTWTKSARTLL